MTLFHFICVSALIHSGVLPLNTLTALLQVVNYIFYLYKNVLLVFD